FSLHSPLLSDPRALHSFPTRRSSDLNMGLVSLALALQGHERWWSVFRERFAWLLPHYVVYGFIGGVMALAYEAVDLLALAVFARSEEHTSELQSRGHLVCRLLLEKKK